MLEARQLGYAFSRAPRPVVAELDWQATPGEVEALVGPNGAGKTTLLRLLSGELTPSLGTVLLEGRALARWSALALAGRRAFLTQSPRLDFAFTVREVVAMGRSPHLDPRERAQDEAILAQVLRELDLEAFAERPFPSLSRGEKQRVQLARVLAQVDGAPPGVCRYLFLDEPVNHLDLAHQHITLALARRRARAGHAVVVVLHDLNLALRYTDRVTMLDEGRAVARGRPREVFTPERLQGVFGVTARLHEGHGGHPFLEIDGAGTELSDS
jgi:iron complex transport system ATP-binding protein